VYKTPNIKRRLAIIFGGTLLFMAGLGAFLFWYLGGQEEAAKREANKFISALVKNKPSAAPENGDDYVRGIWKAYRRVDSAKLIDTHQRHSRSGSSKNSGSSWWVADMLVHSGRGLAVLELAFERNNLDPDEQVIDLMYELTLDRIPAGVLDDGTLARVKSDLGERGGKVEDGITLSISESELPSGARPRVPKAGSPASPASPAAPAKPQQSPVIKCIRRAHGDVDKLKKCSRLA
jgi:hypothetical protein